ncbi:hypothetical protein ACFCX4_35665 [Kitasatospora sp. NPDC056327]|uniref:hypothetical protein n=1 Tax=Kitasatospora sp. NPDC056327 TaxID=3345785 RepID=UPI0035E2880F
MSDDLHDTNENDSTTTVPARPAVKRPSRTTAIAALALLAIAGAGVDGGLLGSAAQAVGAPSATSGAPVSGQELVTLLTGMLPAGTVETVETRGTDQGIPGARIVLDDGAGKAQIELTVLQGVDPGSDCPVASTPEDVCTVSHLPDGSKLVVARTGAGATEPAGSLTWTAFLSSQKGYTLFVREWNRASTENGSPVTRTLPPLTTDQLGAVATATAWERVGDALYAASDTVSSTRS